MLKVKRSQLLRYGFAVLAVAIALVFKLLLQPWIGLEDTPFLVFFVPIMITAWYGGIGPGLVATFLAAWVSQYFFLNPNNLSLSANSIGQNWQLALFVLEGLLISAVVTALQSAKHRAEFNKLEAQHHQESLRQSEEGFRLLVDNVKDYAIYRLDANGRIASWNKGAERIKGYLSEEIIGQHLSRCYPIEDIQRGKPEQHLKRAAETGQFEEEGWRIRKDGSPFWASVVITALRDEAGHLKGFSNVTRDITDNKRAEAERNQLLAKEQATRAIAEAATAMVQRLQAITDVAIAPLSLDDLLRELLNRITDILQADIAVILMMDAENNNLVVRAAKGLQEEKLRHEINIPIGQGFAGCVADQRQPMIVDQDAYTQVYSSVLREQQIESLIGVPLLVEDKLIGVIHVGTLLARQFTKDDVQLLKLVADRAALAIDHARLYEAERNALAQAQEANRLKDEFLAIVSHELRTPIQSILGWTQMLRTRKLNEEIIAKAFDTMERNAKQQVKLIDDILDVSRIIRGNIRLHIVPLNVVPIIELAITVINPAAEAKSMQLDSALDRSVGLVCADPDRLQQIVGNLLSNAIKFTPEGGQVYVTVERIESYVQIAVKDTGEGIRAESLPYIFEGFRQGDGSITRSHGGLGLGLTIVRYLVELLGGTVYAASEGEGTGATFIVKLPIVKAEVKSKLTPA